MSLFQGIKAFGGNVLMRKRPHVGVQLNPELQSIEPESAQEYLESYFGEDNVTIYWGALDSFVKRLRTGTGRAGMSPVGLQALARARKAPDNPYVGARAFRRNNQLFGRDREARDLESLFVAERIVLLHAPSGAGKTSLIQAKLMPSLEASSASRDRFGSTRCRRTAGPSTRTCTAPSAAWRRHAAHRRVTTTTATSATG